MNTKYLGRTGVRISELCLGTMTFGWRADERISHAILDAFRDEGGNFIDTADVYAGGKSEQIAGEWLKRNGRDDFVVATKIRFQTSGKANDIGLSRRHILSGVRSSLKRLQTDYIDLYQIHAWDPATPVEETLRALQTLVDDGVVRYIGASNLRAWQLQLALDSARENGLSGFVSLQPQYSLLCRATEFELIPACRHNGLAVNPWSPLGRGLLTGKYSREMKSPPENTRIGASYREGRKDIWDRQNNDLTWRIVETVGRIAAETGRTHSQIALNWLLGREGVTSPTLGVSSVEQLRDNAGAAGWRLEKDYSDELDMVSSPQVSYPYDQAAEEQQKRGREDFQAQE